MNHTARRFSTPLRRPRACTASSERKPTNRIGIVAVVVVVVGGVAVAWLRGSWTEVAAAAAVPVASCATGCRQWCRRVGVGAGNRRVRGDGGAAVAAAAVRGDGDGDSPP